MEDLINRLRTEMWSWKHKALSLNSLISYNFEGQTSVDKHTEWSYHICFTENILISTVWELTGCYSLVNLQCFVILCLLQWWIQRGDAIWSLSASASVSIPYNHSFCIYKGTVIHSCNITYFQFARSGGWDGQKVFEIQWWDYTHWCTVRKSEVKKKVTVRRM